MVVPVMRQALGLREGGASIHFALGPTELRTFGALAAYLLILLTVEIAGLILLVILAGFIGAAAKMIGTIDGIAAIRIAVWVMWTLLGAFLATIVYITTRLSFLVVAVTVAENRIDLIHAWELTRGNFWRTFWISLFVGAPGWLLYVGIQFAFVGFAATGTATGVFAHGGPVRRRFAVGGGAHALHAGMVAVSLRGMVPRPPGGDRALFGRGCGGVSRSCARRPGSVHSARGSAHSGCDRLGFRTQ